MVPTLDMRNLNWKVFDFPMFEIIFHVAAITTYHQRNQWKSYTTLLNRDLAIENAVKEKKMV